MPVLLAIETSQRLGGVALRDLSAAHGSSKGEICVEMLSQKMRHDDDLLPAIDRLFRRCGFTPRDLSNGGVGVSIGPGGFTGLRIAVATAKMFAEALGAKIIAVPSALVAAESVTNGSRPSAFGSQQLADSRKPTAESTSLIVALASKNETCWATRIDRQSGEPRIIGEPGIVTADSLDLAGITALLGDEHLPPDVRAVCDREHVPVIEPQFDPRACLIVAERMFNRGEFTDPLMLAPLYPREPEAVSLWEKKRNAAPS